MSRSTLLPTHIDHFGFIYRPVYRDKRTGEKRQSNVWWVRYKPENSKRPIQRSTHLTDQADAYRELLKLAGRLGAGDLRDASPERVTWNQLFDLLEADYRRNRRTSLIGTVERIAKHLRPVFGDKRVIDLRRRDVDQFIESRINGYETVDRATGEKIIETLKPSTVNKLLAFMRRAMQLGHDEDPPLVLRIPGWFGKLEEDNVRTGLITHEMYEKLMPVMAPHVRVAFTIGYHLGMRRGEILSLKWDQVDFDAGVIRLDRKQTKNRKPRTAPIYGDMRAVLEFAKAQRDAEYPHCPYVVAKDGKRVRSIRTAWTAAFVRAGLAAKLQSGKRAKIPALFHDLRRTAATNMDAAGISRARIKECVGWKTDAMFERYRIGTDRAAIEVGETMSTFFSRHVSDADTESSVKPS